MPLNRGFGVTLFEDVFDTLHSLCRPGYSCESYCPIFCDVAVLTIRQHPFEFLLLTEGALPEYLVHFRLLIGSANKNEDLEAEGV